MPHKYVCLPTLQLQWMNKPRPPSHAPSYPQSTAVHPPQCVTTAVLVPSCFIFSLSWLHSTTYEHCYFSHADLPLFQFFLQTSLMHSSFDHQTPEQVVGPPFPLSPHSTNPTWWDLGTVKLFLSLLCCVHHKPFHSLVFLPHLLLFPSILCCFILICFPRPKRCWRISRLSR